MRRLALPNERNRTARRYFSLVMWLNGLFAFLISLSWLVGFALLKTPVVALLSSIFIASIALYLSSLLSFHVDRKYKNVSAKRMDYILSNIPVYMIVVVACLILLSVSYMVSEFGNMVIFYVDGVILLVFVLVSKLPSSFLLGGQVSAVSDDVLLSRARVLADRMGAELVDLYKIGWKKFKVANAVQMGHRKFSVLISDHLIEEFPPAEVDAVIAHELAHAKRKHVLKIVAISLCFSLSGLNLLFFVRNARVLTSWHLALFFTGIVLLFGGNFFFTPYISRRFELEADSIAVRTIGDGKTMISALKRLAELNLIPEEKTRMSWGLTHPSISERIKKIQEIVG